MWPLFAMGTCFSLPFNTIGGLWAGPYLLDVHALGKATVSYALLAMVAAFHLGNLLYGPVERRLASRKLLGSRAIGAQSSSPVLASTAAESIGKKLLSTINLWPSGLSTKSTKRSTPGSRGVRAKKNSGRLIA